MYKKAVERFARIEQLIKKLLDLQIETNKRISKQENRVEVFRLQIRSKHFETKRLLLQAEQVSLRESLVPYPIERPGRHIPRPKALHQ